MLNKCKKTGFTIVELLTVMSVIVILLALLVPGLNAVRRHAKVVGQKNLFRNIDGALVSYEGDFQEYPDSLRLDSDNPQQPYCGAMKLAEVLAGHDGLGFNMDSKLYASGMSSIGGSGFALYPPAPRPDPTSDPCYVASLRNRKEYMEARDVRICTLQDLYGAGLGGTNVFTDPNRTVLFCDVFTSVTNTLTGKRMGMPILYYRADTSKMWNRYDSSTQAVLEQNTYNYWDNQDFLALGVPNNGKPPVQDHPLYNTGAFKGQLFYKNIEDKGVPNANRPHNKESFIMISAGWDGIYGTRDDVYNGF